jgi:ribosomal protein S18 acetylase RimI-like enzyme
MSGSFVVDVLTPTGNPDEWADFTAYNEETEEDEPGDLSYALSEMCRGNYPPEQLMYFSSDATHLIGLRKGVEGPLVGFLLLKNPPDADTATILLLCVSEDVKGQKVSTKLLDHAKEMAAGKKALVLEAANDELESKVYTPYGFVHDTAYKSPYYGDSTLRMTLDLAPPTKGGSRVNRKTRRSKGKRRDTKRSKLRYLSSRHR